MLHLVRHQLYLLAQAELDPGENLRNFKTIKKGDWKEVPVKENPSVCFTSGGGLTFAQFQNPLDMSFEIHAVIRTVETKDPDHGEEMIERLMWDCDNSEDWGLIPFILTNRSIQISGTPYHALLTPQLGEVIAERSDLNLYTFNKILIISVNVQRDQIR